MNRLVRIILIVGAMSGLALLGLLAWSTGNASRFAQYHDTLLLLNGVFALAMFVWVLSLTVKLARQLRRRQFGARLTARFALAFALIGVVPGALIYTLSVQFMSRSIESWFNVRVDSALEAGLNLGRAALDTQLAELEARARSMAVELNNTSDANVPLVLTRLREANGVTEAMVFTGSGRMVAFSSSMYGQLLPELPPSTVIDQLRLARGYAAAEACAWSSRFPRPAAWKACSAQVLNRAGCSWCSRWPNRLPATPTASRKGFAITRSWLCPG
mgnify:CR=1 FL=1